jgi:hypothetical protein
MAFAGAGSAHQHGVALLGKGSTPILLATQNTGRGGTGSVAAKVQQAEILRLLRPEKVRFPASDPPFYRGRSSQSTHSTVWLSR